MEFVGLARPVGAPPIPGHMANPNDGIRRSAFGEDLHNPAVRSFGSPNLDLFVGCGHSISKVESRSTGGITILGHISSVCWSFPHSPLLGWLHPHICWLLYLAVFLGHVGHSVGSCLILLFASK